MSLKSLDLDVVKDAVAGSAAALRTIIELEPAGGQGDKIFPPTYEGGKYAEELRRLKDEAEPVNCVLIDSVASQANRMETALQQAWEEKRLQMPVLTVNFPSDLPKPLRVTSLEAPHRISDALLRDSLYKGEPFRKSEIGRVLDVVNNANATPLLRYCPTALLFGLWDSTGPRGGMGVKFPRVLVSELVGTHAINGFKVSSRLDPAQIEKGAGPIFVSGDGWGLKGSKKYGKEGKPSEINHGNVTPSIESGGYTVKKILQTTVLSLPGLRRLRFPVNGEYTQERNWAGRVLLAALGIAGVSLALEQGCDLRSRCFLVPTKPPQWELLATPGQEPERFEVSPESALQILKSAYSEASALGLEWETEEILLEPRPELAELVRRSQELSMSMVEG